MDSVQRGILGSLGGACRARNLGFSNGGSANGLSLGRSRYRSPPFATRFQPRPVFQHHFLEKRAAPKTTPVDTDSVHGLTWLAFAFVPIYFPSGSSLKLLAGFRCMWLGMHDLGPSDWLSFFPPAVVVCVDGSIWVPNRLRTHMP